MVQTTFEMIREKYRKAQAERKRELERERKKLIGPSKDDDDDEKPPHEKKELSVEEADKIIQLREELQNRFKQTRVDEVVDKENREKQFEPITQRLDKVEKAVKQTDEDLSKKLDLMPVRKKTIPSTPQLTFTPEEEDEEEEINEKNIKLIIDKGLGVGSKGLGALPRKYIPFQDKIFGIWYDDERFYIGNENNRVIIDGNDLFINN